MRRYFFMSQESRKKAAEAKAAAELKARVMKKAGIVTTVVVMLIALVIGGITYFNRPRVIAPEDYPIVKMNVQNYGTITIELYPNEAPNTVRNFIELVENGFYDGLEIPRVCENFVLQMGSPSNTLNGGPGWTIKGEFEYNGFKKNTIKHEAGVLSMARGSDPDSAGSQFFICAGTNKSVSSLDGLYAGFGKVIDGLDIVIAISKVDHDNSISAGGGTPYEKIIVTSMTVDTKGINYPAPKKIR